MKCILMSSMMLDRENVEEEIKNIIKPNMKVVCIPFASDLQWLLNGDKTEYIERHYNPFKKYGVKRVDFYVANLKDDYVFIKKKIKRADIVYFSGGYMENLMYHLKEKYLIRFLRLIKDKKIFIGESAGALVLGDTYIELPHIEDHYKIYKKEEGLGIFNNLNVVVHFNPDNENHRHNHEVIKNMTNNEIVCLTDNGMVIIDDKKIKLLGDYYK